MPLWSSKLVGRFDYFVVVQERSGRIICGIFGLSKITPLTTAMAPILAMEMETRGDDSWGVTDGEHYHKDPQSIYDGWMDFTDWMKWDSAIFHTRGASVGPISKQNAHPFFAQVDNGPVILGVHNGHVSNYKELNTKYNRKCEVDSEHIFLHLAEGKDLVELNSSGAIAWYQNKRFSFMKTSSGSLEVVGLKTGEIVICSTAAAIKKACQMSGAKVEYVVNLEPKLEYYLAASAAKANVLGVWRGKDKHFGSNFNTVVHPFAGRHGTHFSTTTAIDTRSNCIICYRPSASAKHVVCELCLKDAKTTTESWMAGKQLKQGSHSLGMYVN